MSSPADYLNANYSLKVLNSLLTNPMVYETTSLSEVLAALAS